MTVLQFLLVGALGLVATAGLLFASLPPVPADAPEAGEEVVYDHAYDAPIGAANEIFVEMLNSLGLPGASVSVGVGGAVVWSRAAGYADVAERRPWTLQTASRIGSVSKSVTSLAVGKLVERGVLDLDASIGQYALPFPAYPITPRQLATHTSGIRHYDLGLGFGVLPSAEMLSNTHYASVNDALQIFADSPLLFEPGTGFNYSTYGYTLLSAVIEAASGAAFVDVIADEVFTPLGMRHTTPEFQDLTGFETASYYTSFAGKLMNAPEVDHSNKWAGGGLLSTPTDLVRMANALMFESFLKPETVEMLLTPQRLRNGEVNEQNYAIGWRVDTINFVSGDADVASYQAVHHGGTSNGASAFLVMFPDLGIAVAMTTNALTLDRSTFVISAYRIAKRFIEFLGEPGA